MGRILFGVGLAIAATATLDFLGYAMLSALPLIPLFFLFAFLDRIPRRELGLIAGTGKGYALALAHPLVVIGLLGWLAYAAGAVDLTALDGAKAMRNIAITALATFVMAIITEEGFFRGWLWAALGRLGKSPWTILITTSIAFVLWHVSFVFISNEFHFEPAHIPYFFANATLLGLIWGMLRLGSGSIVVSSASHGLWNGLVYVLFGVGSGAGALGIKQLGLFGPEVGLYGIALNAAFFAVLWWLYREKLADSRAT